MRAAYKAPYCATDVILEYWDPYSARKGIVLVERKNPPYGLALPGGFAEYGLSLEENACKEVREETNLTISIPYLTRPYQVRSDPQRDPRGHILSVIYVAQGHGVLRAGDDAKAVHLCTREEVKDHIKQQRLAFDHAIILHAYITECELRESARDSWGG